MSFRITKNIYIHKNIFSNVLERLNKLEEQSKPLKNVKAVIYNVHRDSDDVQDDVQDDVRGDAPNNASNNIPNNIPNNTPDNTPDNDIPNDTISTINNPVPYIRSIRELGLLSPIYYEQNSIYMVGLTVESLYANGLYEFIRFKDGQPYSIMYDRLSIYLINCVKELETRLNRTIQTFTYLLNKG